MGFAYWLVFVISHICISIVCLPVYLTKSPYESFQLLARQGGGGKYLDSYDQHLVFQRISVATAIFSVTLVIIKILTVVLISLYSISPDLGSAAGGGEQGGCQCDRHNFGGTLSDCVTDQTFVLGGSWLETGHGCLALDFVWEYYDYSTGQTTSMAPAGTAFTVPINPILDVPEDNIESQTVTCKTTGKYLAKVDIDNIPPESYLIYINTPAVPSGASATPNSENALTVSWNDNANNEEYYRIEYASYAGSCGAYSEDGTTNQNISSYNLDGLSPNQPYCARVRASNPVGNTSYSTAAVVRTYAPDPNTSSARSASTWYTSGDFTFSNNDSWGAGGVEYFRYAWDTSNSHTWTGAETTWSSGTLSLNTTDTTGKYLHLKSYNADDASSDSAVVDLGPYFFDSTEPPATTQVKDGASSDINWANSSSSLAANWPEIVDATSGLLKYQYAIGTSSGGTDVRDWTNHDTSTSISLTGLSLTEGSTYYLSIRGVDNAGLAGDTTSSDGVTLDLTNPLIIDNETTDRGWLNAGPSFNVDFTNQSSGSLLDSAQYAVGSTSGATDVIDWTNIFSNDVNGYTTNWTVDFQNLQEGENYVSVRTTDLASNTLTESDVFTVKKDAVAATISQISSQSETTQATITWQTSEPATTQIEWGPTQSLGYTTTLISELTTEHTVTLTGLNEGQTYYYQILANDRANNNSQSNILNLATSELEPTLITNALVSEISETEAKVTWETNHPATSKVRFGPTTAYGQEVFDSTLVADHALVLSDLTPGTTYHYEVLSTGNTVAIDADATFTTSEETPAEEEPEEEEPEEETPPSEPVPGPYIFDLPTPTVVSPQANETTKTRQPVITGLALSSNLIKVFIDGIYNGYTSASNDQSGTGNFSYKPFLNLTVGTHTLQVEAWSEKHRSQKSSLISFVVPVSYVTPTVIQPLVKDGPNPEVVISGVAKNNSRIVIQIDGQEVAETKTINDPSGTGSFSVVVSTNHILSSGEHKITVVAYSQNGLASLPTTPVSFTKTTADHTTKPTLIFGRTITYRVSSGDCLWNIAKKFLGNGARYQEIVALNIISYPSLSAQPNYIRPNWELNIAP
ncbi:MAG: fibronectin type III domain-containing protein [Patescibacteria group bacterium]|nr:fibronectin type III domain-containing protein [Patescibacteria group bacterium]